MRDCGSSSFTPISYTCFFHCGSAGAVVLSPFHIHPFSTAGVRDCGSSSFIPISYSSFFHFGSAGAVVLSPFHIHPFPTVGVRDCGSHRLPAQTFIDFGTAGASVQCHAIVAGYSEVAPFSRAFIPCTFLSVHFTAHVTFLEPAILVVSRLCRFVVET